MHTSKYCSRAAVKWNGCSIPKIAEFGVCVGDSFRVVVVVTLNLRNVGILLCMMTVTSPSQGTTHNC